MYKTGYDPVAFVDFFEKIQAMEKTKKGTIGQYFSSHPPTDSRITNAQKNIQDNLESRPEYMVTTSEFNKGQGSLGDARESTPRRRQEQGRRPLTLKQKPGPPRTTPVPTTRTSVRSSNAAPAPTNRMR